MRAITASLLDAITGASSVRMLVKAIVDPTRIFFDTLTNNNPYDASPDYDAITDTPVGQCMCYSPTQNAAVTFIVDPTSGSIYAMVQGSSSKNDLSLTADEDTKPAVWDLGNGSAYLWYWNGSNLKRCTINMSTWGVSGDTTVTLPSHPNWSVVGGSPHAISASVLVFTYLTSIGGIGIDYYDGGDWFVSPGRFLSANTETVLDWTIYSTAVQFGTSIFVYATDVDTGEINGIEFNGSKSVWTDSFLAMPADLSRVCICNSVVANGYIHVAGQFHRTGDLVDAKIYSLVLRSLDGRTFSWDRFTLLSTLGYQFQIGLDNTNKKVFASDRNCVGVQNMSCFFHTTPPDRVTLEPPSDIINLSINSNGTGTMKLSSYNEAYMFHDVIKKGSRLLLYLGYETTEGEEYTKYGTYIIGKSPIGFSSGERQLVLGLVDYGTWLTAQLAFPFYAEILSKTSMHDDCNLQDHMYPVSTASNNTYSTLVIDFWGNDYWDGDSDVTGVEFRFRFSAGLCCEFRTLTNYQGATDAQLFKTVDLDKHPFMTEYPTILDETMTVKLYGWEHTEETARPNCEWALYAITAPADDLTDKTVTEGTLVSTYTKFPRDYPSAQAGSYPIEFDFATLTEGHKLLYFGLALSNSVVGSSVANPERLEVTGVQFIYSQASSSNAWTPEPYSTASADQKLKMPTNGLPSVLFALKPYTALKFNTSADFIYVPGDDPIPGGTTAFGCIGIAKDGLNFIMARYKLQASEIQLVKVRNGVETVLDTYSLVTTPEGIMLDHRDGICRVWYKVLNSKTWTGPVITYFWDEPTEGVISESSTGIMHTGVYGSVAPPSFLCAGFNVADAAGVGIIAGHDESILDAFPASGIVVIDGIKYTYDGKTGNPDNTRYGPYQGRQTDNYGTYYENGTTYTGKATEIAQYMPEKEPLDLEGLLFCTDNGHTWRITKSDWDVWHSTAGVPFPLRHRSRHYTDLVNGNLIGPLDRVNIVPGLLNLALVEGNTYMHPYGALVAGYGTDEIFVKDILSTMVEHDATVANMIAMLCRSACVQAGFPGDWTSSSIALSGTPSALASSKYLFPGGYDITLDMPGLTASQWIAIYADNLIYNDGSGDTKFDIGIKNDADVMVIYVKGQGVSYPELYFKSELDPTLAHTARFFFHDEFISVYVDNIWQITFGLGEDNLTWPKNTQVLMYAYASTSKTVTNVVVSELFDWREAIYVESELSAQSALGSVIQERPIEILPTIDGGLDFSYNITRDQITYTSAISKRIMHSHFRDQDTSGDAGSDAIIYSTDISFVSYDNFAKEEGFLTKVYKLSNLEHGAEATGKILLEKAYESQFIHQITMRPDIRIESGDRLSFSYVVPGTGTTIDYDVIVEGYNIEVEEGNYRMSIRAREDIA
jgi:hypothetical protein